MKLHAPLLPLAFFLMIGIAAGDQFADYFSGWQQPLALLVVAVLPTCLLYRYPRWQTAGIWLCLLMLGVTLGCRQHALLAVEWSKEASEWHVVVVEEPVVKERFVVADVLTDNGHHKIRCRIRRDHDSERLTVGDGLTIHTYINKVHEWRNGTFSYRRHQQCHGFTGEAFVDSGHWQWESLSLSQFSMLQRVRLHFMRWRHQLLEQYAQWHIEGQEYGIIAAMTLGDKSQLDTTLKDTYSRVGASHILALSGMHLMIIYAVISLFAGWSRHRLFTQCTTVLAIWAFAFLVGLSSSVVRSAAMITIYALLSVGHRERMSVNTLAFVAIAMLAWNPYALWDVGFQLSFMAVLSILLFNPLFQRLVPLHVLQQHRLTGKLWGLATVSVSAQVGTAPLVVYYFGRFATWFLLTNIIVIPLATMMLYGAVVLMAIIWWPATAGIVAQGLSGTAWLMNALLERVAMLPMSSIDNITLSPLKLLLVYVVIGCAYVLLSLNSSAIHRNG